MLDGCAPQENRLVAGHIDLVSQTEGQLTDLLAVIIKESKENFLRGGYILEADIERRRAPKVEPIGKIPKVNGGIILSLLQALA